MLPNVIGALAGGSSDLESHMLSDCRRGSYFYACKRKGCLLVQRMFGPERAILIECGDAVCWFNILRAGFPVVSARIACFVGPSFQDGRGSCARAFVIANIANNTNAALREKRRGLRPIMLEPFLHFILKPGARLYRPIIVFEFKSCECSARALDGTVLEFATSIPHRTQWWFLQSESMQSIRAHP